MPDSRKIFVSQKRWYVGQNFKNNIFCNFSIYISLVNTIKGGSLKSLRFLDNLYSENVIMNNRRIFFNFSNLLG